MKLLVTGNSQGGALRLALKEGLLEDEETVRPDFYVVPGGTGPYFTLQDGKLLVTAFNDKFPPYMDPPDTGDRRIEDYDAVLVSALGYVDGGFVYDNPIPKQGYVAEFLPRKDRPERPLISGSCLADIMRPALMRQPGFVFLQELRDKFSGRILVQPFPYSSEYLAEREDWEVRRIYEDYIGFNRFLFQLRDHALREICDELGVELLDPPDPSWSVSCFTPRALMRDSDGLHPMPAYGAMVLRQVTETLDRR